MGGSSKKQTVGYKYYIGMHMVLCHGPVDKITAIEVDGKTAWSGNSTGGEIDIDAGNLFGGEDREGGVSGAVDILMGSSSQPKNDYLQARLGSGIPAFRGVVSAVLNQVYVGLNPYLKPWSFWAERVHTRSDGSVQWYDSAAAVGTDMNPAHIIRECLTDANWGMGYSDSDIDDISFMSAADQMLSEGMGLSLLWDKSTKIDEFIQVVLQHIDGSLYVDRGTGLFVLKLARGGYDVDSLLLLNEDSIEKISDFKRNTVGELVNSVTVIYTDGATGNQGSVTVQDIALAAQQQATIGTTKQFPGITSGELASRVASRALKALSVPLASATVYADRSAASLNVGDVFKLSWSQYGLTQVVMRVANIELGSLGSNIVKIACIEDVFSIGEAVYAAPPPSEWASPVSAPSPCPYHSVIEAPYWEVVQRLGETEAQAKAADSGYIVATGVRPSDDASNAKIWSNPTGTLYEEAGTVDFTPSAVTDGDVSDLTQTVIPIESAIDIDIVQTNTYAVWGSELVRVDAVSANSMTVARGCLDTVPVAHSDQERIFFSDPYYETDRVEYVDGEVAAIKILPTTGQGTLDISAATEQNVTLNSRLSRPYPPARIELNGNWYPETVPGDQDLVVTWRHRDRLQQTATIIGGEVDSDIGPEGGTTYTVELRTAGGTLVSSATGISANTHTFTLASMGSNYGYLRVLLWSVRDSLDSYQAHDYQFYRAGYGTGYGLYYGGSI